MKLAYALALTIAVTAAILVGILVTQPVPRVIAQTGIVDPCFSSQVLKTAVPINIVAAGTSQLVAPVAGQIVYVCGGSFTIAPSGTSADSIQFITGTGATCGGSTSTKSGTYGAGDLTTTTGVVAIELGSNGSGMDFSSASGAGLCAVAAGTTVNIQGLLTVIQQ